MIVMKDCPNCGSFDIDTIMQIVGGGAWMACRACGADWDEGISGVGFDLADDDFEYEPPADAFPNVGDWDSAR